MRGRGGAGHSHSSLSPSRSSTSEVRALFLFCPVELLNYAFRVLLTAGMWQVPERPERIAIVACGGGGSS